MFTLCVTSTPWTLETNDWSSWFPSWRCDGGWFAGDARDWTDTQRTDHHRFDSSSVRLCAVQNIRIFLPRFWRVFSARSLMDLHMIFVLAFWIHSYSRFHADAHRPHKKTMKIQKGLQGCDYNSMYDSWKVGPQHVPNVLSRGGKEKSKKSLVSNVCAM